jgi:hypothetical protein
MPLDEIPSPCACPKCEDLFAVLGRMVLGSGTPDAMDVLEWKCAGCDYEEKECRRMADGSDGAWPPSRYF